MRIESSQVEVCEYVASGGAAASGKSIQVVRGVRTLISGCRFEMVCPEFPLIVTMPAHREALTCGIIHFTCNYHDCMRYNTNKIKLADADLLRALEERRWVTVAAKRQDLTFVKDTSSTPVPVWQVRIIEPLPSLPKTPQPVGLLKRRDVRLLIHNSDYRYLIRKATRVEGCCPNGRSREDPNGTCRRSCMTFGLGLVGYSSRWTPQWLHLSLWSMGGPASILRSLGAPNLT